MGVCLWGLKITITKVPIPVPYGPAFQGERVRKEDMCVELAGAEKPGFEFLTTRDLGEAYRITGDHMYGIITGKGAAGRSASEHSVLQLVASLARAYWDAMMGLPRVRQDRKRMMKLKKVSR